MELFYLSPERRVMSVRVDSRKSAFEPGIPRALFEVRGLKVDRYGRSCVVSGDGQRFLINTILPEASSPIQIVVNWTPERNR
jgi:hypothetical protein